DVEVLNGGLEILKTVDLREALKNVNMPFLRLYGYLDGLVPRKTIPELLIETYGNQTEVARRLSCHRNTVRRYLYDKEARYHAI
ncbi:hypothetical protein MJI46_34685, partial [Salmonella enterica subsp. enterica serovar Cerro]|nr:hypothetical protein [Salmonella enterica subsp. enterica serovar Cerro]